MKTRSSLLLLLFFSTILFGQEKNDSLINSTPSVYLKTAILNSDVTIAEDISSRMQYELTDHFYYQLQQRLPFPSHLRLNWIRADIAHFNLAFGCSHDGIGGEYWNNSFIDQRTYWRYEGYPYEFRFHILGQKHNLYLRGTFGSLARDFNDGFHECGNLGVYPSNGVFSEDYFLGQSTFGLGYELAFKNELKGYLESNFEFIGGILRNGV